jgi:hypothetical protein
MAEVYRVVRGRKLEHLVAKTADVQDGLDDLVGGMALHAESLLDAHRDEGHAAIEVESGDVDRYVVLTDERGDKAALSIEFGRKPDADGDGGMEGLAVLRRAAGLL